MSPSPVPAATLQVPIPLELPTTADLSWGEQLDVCVPLPNVLSTDEEEDVLDFEEEGQSDFLLSEEEEDFEDSPFLPPAHLATQPLAAAGSTEDTLLSVDLQDVCKRAAEKLNIPWPTVVAETAKSRYEGKRLPRAKRAAWQLLPVFPELLEEVAVTWKDKPFTSKMLVQGGSALDMEGMEKAGLAPHGAISCSALTLMQKRCKEKKRDDEALQLCMPRKTDCTPSTTSADLRTSYGLPTPQLSHS